MAKTLLAPPFAVTDGRRRHARYAELAAAGPVHRIVLPTGEPTWLITGHDEVRQSRIALGTLLARFPRLRPAVPAEQLTW